MMILAGIRLTAFKLAQEADVVFGEETQVFHAIFEVCDTLNSHSEGIAGIDFAVYATSFEDVRIQHSAAQDFNPSGSFAECASLTAADIATDIHLG